MFMECWNTKKGVSLIESILAVALFGMLVTALVGSYIYGQESIMTSGNRNRAVLLAEEGLEVAANIRDNDFANLVDGTYGIGRSGGEWQFSGSSDSVDIYTRELEISAIDDERKSVVSTVTWQQNEQRQGEVELETILANWASPYSNLCAFQGPELAIDSGSFSKTSKEVSFTIENGAANCEIVIEDIEIAWVTPGGSTLQRITIDGVRVHQGNKTSGSIVDIDDTTLPASSGDTDVVFRFNKTNTLVQISIVFHMSDGSTQSVFGIVL